MHISYLKSCLDGLFTLKRLIDLTKESCNKKDVKISMSLVKILPQKLNRNNKI